MRLPRIHLRTLMIAVAVVGVECWAYASGPTTLVVALYTTGPLVGCLWAGRYRRGRVFPYISGGSFGGAAQGAIVATLVVGVVAFRWAVGEPIPDDPWDDLAGALARFLVVSVVVGIVLGTVVQLGASLVFLATLPWRSVSRRPAKPTDRKEPFDGTGRPAKSSAP